MNASQGIYPIRYCTGGCQNPDHKAHIYSTDPKDGALGAEYLCPGNAGCDVREVIDEDGNRTLDGFIRTEHDHMIIGQIIAASQAWRLTLRGNIVAKRDCLCSDGKYRSPWGIPHGVTTTGEYSAPYYVQQAKDGTTYGNRYESPEAITAMLEANDERATAEFRTALEEMTPERLQSQYRYWIKD